MSVSVTYSLGGVVQLVTSATPPTGAQAALVPKMFVQVSFTDADTQALITHNWGLGASDYLFGDPEVLAELAVLPPDGGTFLPGFTYDRTNTNVLSVNILNTVGSAGTYNFTLRLPHSVGQ